MKKSRNEKLSDYLLNIDDNLLTNAYQIDDAEKLKQYVKAKNTKHKKALPVRPKIYRYATVAACIAIFIGITFALLPLLNSRDPMPDIDPWDTSINGDGQNQIHIPEPEAIVFDSLDKVNYYAGLKTILDSERTRAGISGKKAKTSFLSCNMNSRDSIQPLSSTSEADLDNRPADEEDVTPVIGGHDISEEPLRITTAIYFQLQVSEADEFLASKVGVGNISAVITDLYIGINPFAMITFKNGDRYFSCLTEMHGLQEIENTFGTHLYIKGFNFYKDTTNGVSNFKVIRDAETDQITSVSWIPYHRRPAEAPVYPITVIPNSTHTSNAIYEFTLLELEEYYNGSSQETEKNDDTTEPMPEIPIPEAPKPEITVHTEADFITPLSCPLWQEYYDEAVKSWAEAIATSDAYTVLTSGEAEIPVLKFSGEVSIAITGKGTLSQQVKVYYRNENGAYLLRSDRNISIGELDDLLTTGEWYVVFSVEWQDDYVASENKYEKHCNEYLFKLVIE